MKKIIIDMGAKKSPEVFHNNHLYTGFYSEEYETMKERDLKISRRFSDVIKTGKLPKLVEDVLEKRKDVSPERINDIPVVFRKVTALMAQGFHAKIVVAMLRCATGGGCSYGFEFQEKFGAAMDKGVRKDFWGTEYRFPLVVAEDLLKDMLEKEIDVDNPTEEDISRSSFYKEFVTDREA